PRRGGRWSDERSAIAQGREARGKPPGTRPQAAGARDEDVASRSAAGGHRFGQGRSTQAPPQLSRPRSTSAGGQVGCLPHSEDGQTFSLHGSSSRRNPNANGPEKLP